MMSAPNSFILFDVCSLLTIDTIVDDDDEMGVEVENVIV